jgi:hypothetical protein
MYHICPLVHLYQVNSFAEIAIHFCNVYALLIGRCQLVLVDTHHIFLTVRSNGFHQLETSFVNLSFTILIFSNS